MTFRTRRGYHHGDLREALIEATLGLVAERGVAAVTLADVARAVGVSPAAPYRHFSDLNAVIVEVARRGFERFKDALEAAWDGGRPDPMTAIETLGRAYLAFARREPASYAIMFDPSPAIAADPGLKEASARAFGVLRQAADLAAAGVAAARRPPAMMVALHLWAFAHGVATLFVGRSEATRFRMPMSPEDLLEAGLLIYLQSLGLNRG
jgi:AcrR family transcriptional regulator